MAVRQTNACRDVGRLLSPLAGARRILIFGEMGVGKSTLAMALGPLLAERHGVCHILSLDPGNPPFGIPGALSRGRWRDGRFAWGPPQALCSLDAYRFRLPLVQLAKHLLGDAESEAGTTPILIDPPGLIRGAGAAELLHALVESLFVDTVITLARSDRPQPLGAALAALAVDIRPHPSPGAARRPGRLERCRQRTRLWDAWLDPGVVVAFDPVNLVGTPPPRHLPQAWQGRQVGLLAAGGATLTMGEVLRLEAGRLILRLPADISPASVSALLLRDAGRSAAGGLETTARANGTPAWRGRAGENRSLEGAAKDQCSRPVAVRVGNAWATLVGGAMGDPLVHVRLRHRKESLFFDLGNCDVPPRVVHQVKAVFLTHAHLDHIAGFIRFLRARIGFYGRCRIFGPPTTIQRIEHFLSAITWDRIEANGPRFEVSEIVGDRLISARLQAGRSRVDLPDRRSETGVVFIGEDYRVNAVACDHGIPSIAYALAFDREIHVRKERLKERGWPAGPWLGHLKQCIASDDRSAAIVLPDGTKRPAAELAAALTLVRPGKRLVYAADMADTADNRQKLVTLARGAHTLFCEAAFAAADSDKAAATQHLTTVAAVAVARAARVQRLVPFHFSKRYESDPGRLFTELRALAGSVMITGHG